MPKRRLYRIALYVLAGLLVLGVGLFLFRNSVAGFIIENYLAGEGIAGRVTVLRLGDGGATLKVLLGPGEAPDASAETVDVVIGKGPYGGRVEAVTLTDAFMHIRYDGKKISYGSLTDFVERMLNEPSSQSDFVVKDLPITLKRLRVRVTTQGKSIDLMGEGAIRGGQIEWLNLQSGAGGVGLYGYGYRYVADMKRLVLRMTGTPRGLDIRGALTAKLRGNVDISSADLVFAARDVRFGSTIALPRVDISGDVKLDTTQAAKFASAIPYWSSDAQNHAAAMAALADFNADIRDLALTFEGRRMGIATSYADFKSRSGAKLSLDAKAQIDGGNGRAGISGSLRDGGFAVTALDLRNLVWTSAGTRTDGQVDLTAGFTAQMLRDASVKGRLRFAIDSIAARVDLIDCMDVTIGGLRSGKALAVTRLATKACAFADQPLFAMDTKGWRARLAFAGAGGHIVAADAALSGASGTAMIDGAGDPQTGVVTIDGARLSDALAKPRFGALAGRGRITLANGVWRGDLAVSHAARRAHVGHIRFSHVLASGVGEATIDAKGIVFTRKGLQPVDLSPALVNVAKAEGKADFSGKLSWHGSKITSSGDLVVKDSQFATPLGNAHGGDVKIRFASLIPLVAAPGQQAEVTRIDWVSSLTESFARFGFTQERITIQAAGTNAAKGVVKIDPLTIYLDSQKGIEGRLTIAHMDLGQLLADSNLGEDVKIVARVSGTVPFQVTNEGFRVKEGKVAADAPGRLMIKRSLWIGTRTTVPNAVEDFAYQALENLAFDKLEGTLNSLPGGRMQLIFHIVGYNDPAGAKPTEVDVISLVKGEAFQTPMPLPKGTAIDLTLDTNLNFDEILRAYRNAWADTKAENRERIKR